MSKRAFSAASALLGLAIAAFDCSGVVAGPIGGDAAADSAPGSTSGSTSGGSSSGGSSGGSSTSSGGSTSSGSSSSGGGSSTSGSSGGGACSPACGAGFTCCQGACVNTQNDPLNCGHCGVTCGPGLYCTGTCQKPPCATGTTCSSGTTCCGMGCCTAGQLCCESSGGVVALYPSCFTPTASQPTCPRGCPLCVSDRNVKAGIVPLGPRDEQAVLESLASMPLPAWSSSEDEACQLDAHGMALAAIKALHDRLAVQRERLDRLENAR